MCSHLLGGDYISQIDGYTAFVMWLFKTVQTELLYGPLLVDSTAASLYNDSDCCGTY